MPYEAIDAVGDELVVWAPHGLDSVRERVSGGEPGGLAQDFAADHESKADGSGDSGELCNAVVHVEQAWVVPDVKVLDQRDRHGTHVRAR